MKISHYIDSLEDPELNSRIVNASDIQLKMPFPVELDSESETDWVASFYEADIEDEGASQGEAVSRLLDRTLKEFRLLNAKDQLTPEESTKLYILSNFFDFR